MIQFEKIWCRYGITPNVSPYPGLDTRLEIKITTNFQQRRYHELMQEIIEIPQVLEIRSVFKSTNKGTVSR